MRIFLITDDTVKIRLAIFVDVAIALATKTKRPLLL